MIRVRTALLAMGACAAFSASPAFADVMEVGPDGARWIAGGNTVADTAVEDVALIAEVEAQIEDVALMQVDEVPLDLAVPDHVVDEAEARAQAVPALYRAKVAELAARFDLSPVLIEAMVWQESRWRADAVSPVGARGLAQLMPGTARELGVDPRDPFANLEGGARYLRAQLDRFGGDVEKALAAYNAGPGRVMKAGGIPRIRETQLYVASIMGRLSDPARPGS